jgi:hypothetical protein
VTFNPAASACEPDGPAPTSSTTPRPTRSLTTLNTAQHHAALAGFGLRFEPVDRADPSGLLQEPDQRAADRLVEPDAGRHQRGSGQQPGAVDPPVDRGVRAGAGQPVAAERAPAAALTAVTITVGTAASPSIPRPRRRGQVARPAQQALAWRASTCRPRSPARTADLHLDQRRRSQTITGTAGAAAPTALDAINISANALGGGAGGAVVAAVPDAVSQTARATLVSQYNQIISRSRPRRRMRPSTASTCWTATR